MKKFIEHLRNQAIAGNKIIVVGNKDLERDYGDIIDGYDIVIRFSLSNYLIAKDEAYRARYGVNILFVL